MIKFRAWDKKNNQFICDWDAGELSTVEINSDGTFRVIEKILTCHCNPDNACGGCADDYTYYTYNEGEHLTLSQSTGLKDKNGVEIFEGDLLNIFYTSGNGQHIHDCIHSVRLNGLGLEFNFVKLLWMDNGYNQLPCSTTLCERYQTLDYGYYDESNERVLMVPDKSGENRLRGNRWKQEDKSMYFEVIGNIHSNPELMEQS